MYWNNEIVINDTRFLKQYRKKKQLQRRKKFIVSGFATQHITQV